MNTRDVAQRLGLASVTLRLWERRKLVGPIRRDARGWRTWTERDVAACSALLAKLHGTNSKALGAR